MKQLTGKVFNFNDIFENLNLNDEANKIQCKDHETSDLLDDLRILLKTNRTSTITFLVTDHSGHERYGLIDLAFRDKESLDFILKMNLLPDSTRINPEPVARLFYKLLSDCAGMTDQEQRNNLQSYLKRKITECEAIGNTKSIRFTISASQIYNSLFNKEIVTIQSIRDQMEKINKKNEINT